MTRVHRARRRSPITADGAEPAAVSTVSSGRIISETQMVGFGILVGLVVVLGGLLFAFGLMGDQKILIGIGLLLLALCAIFGVQPDWPVKRRVE